MIKKTMLLSCMLILPILSMRRGAPTRPRDITASRTRANNALKNMASGVTDNQFYNFADQVRAEIDYLNSVNRQQFANQIEVELLKLLQARRARRAPDGRPRPPQPRPVPSPAPDTGPSPMQRSQMREMQRRLKECQDENMRLQEQLAQKRTQEGANEELVQENRRLNEEIQNQQAEITQLGDIAQRRTDGNMRLQEQLAQKRTQEGANEELMQRNKHLRERLQNCINERFNLREQLRRFRNAFAAFEQLKRNLTRLSGQFVSAWANSKTTHPGDIGDYQEFLKKVNEDEFNKTFVPGLENLRKEMDQLYNDFGIIRQEAQNLNAQLATTGIQPAEIQPSRSPTRIPTSTSSPSTSPGARKPTKKGKEKITFEEAQQQKIEEILSEIRKIIDQAKDEGTLAENKDQIQKYINAKAEELKEEDEQLANQFQRQAMQLLRQER